MYILQNFAIILASVSAFLIAASFMLSKKNNQDREKNSQFECGFDPFSPSRLPFSLRFFMITVIFLIFDVEIALLLPLIPATSETKLPFWIGLGILFLIVLTAGTIFEWSEQSFDWK